MELLDRFDRDGYAILPKFFADELIDRVLARVAGIKREQPANVVVDLLDTGERTSLALLPAGEATRRRMKVNDLYLTDALVRELALAERLVPVLRTLLREVPVVCNSLYFDYGSAQPAHVDSLYMTPRTPLHLIATWVALEDARADAGPLEYYPGSHRIEPMRFSDGSLHAIAAEMPAWHTYMEREVARLGLRKESFPAKKGDVLIWHANLLHGGGPIANPQATRKSFVFHFYSETDCRANGCRLVAQGGAFWMDRAPQPLPPEAVAKLPFSEEAYLRRYPDVAAAVRAGTMPSGRQHWEAFGKNEGRVPY